MTNPNTEQQSVVITGFIDGVDKTEAKNRMAELFKATPGQIDKVCSNLPYIAKRGLNFEQASRYRSAFKQAGFTCSSGIQGLEIDLPVEAQNPPPLTFLNQVQSSERGADEGKKVGLGKTVFYATGALIFAVGLYSSQAPKIMSALSGSPSSRLANAVSAGSSNSSGGAKVLYEYWQSQNKPEPGAYEDEYVDGQLLLTCEASGGKPAHFGWIRVKTVFMITARPDAKPFKVFVGGVKWGPSTQTWIGPEEGNGIGILERLKLTGCKVPDTVFDSQQSLQSPKVSSTIEKPDIATSAESSNATNIAGTPGGSEIRALPNSTPNSALPAFSSAEPYGVVRTRLITQGWTPYKGPNADTCEGGDKRCEGRPEMESCAGTGLAACKFLWRRDGKTLAVHTIGEDEAKVDNIVDQTPALARPTS